MDPLSLIIAALVAGASAAGEALASSAVKGAYKGLKVLLVNRFRKQSLTAGSAVDPVQMLQAHEAKPEIWNAPLEDMLRQTGADADQEILAAAKALLELADPHGAIASKYHIDLRGAQGVQVGDDGQMTVNLGSGGPHPRGTML